MQLILASSSVFRQVLLQRLRLSFIAVSPNINESIRDHETPEQLVQRLAISKAHAVGTQHTEALIIGCDQVAVAGDKILGKPVTHASAVEQLMFASGKRLTFLTGLCLLNTSTGRQQTDLIPYYVVFRELTEKQVAGYLHREKAYDCVGAFKSEGLGIALCKHFEGDDPTALIGLPLIRLVSMLEREGVCIL